MIDAAGAPDVTLVIPARDASRTMAACLDAAIAIRERAGSRLARIVLVDDGSRDDTGGIARSRGIEVIDGTGRGPAAARNIGWRAARTPLVWFVDADCVAQPDALERLLPHLGDPRVAGVGGTYGIAPGATLLERLIHEEIMVRHARMPDDVDFLATFDVVYRRGVLESLGGFDERYVKAQDAEFAFRVIEAGHRLRFDRASVVLHHHADRLGRYLRVQRAQGRWRVALHLERRGRAHRNSYSSALDHLQPVLPLAAVPACAAAVLGMPWWVAALPWVLLVILQCPMAAAMVARSGPAMGAFVPLGVVRSVARCLGLCEGVLDRLRSRAPGGKP
jgi:glycosyltransferase involved in cell wall biosynthesis